MLIPFVFFEKNASPLKRISSMLVVRETSSFEAWRKLSTLKLTSPTLSPHFPLPLVADPVYPHHHRPRWSVTDAESPFFFLPITTHFIYNTTEKVGYAELCTSLYIVIRRSFFFLNYIFQSCTTRTYRDVEMTCVKIGFQEYILL